jgi:hypothetical protein
MEMKTKLLITGLAFLALTILANAQNKTTGQAQQTAPPITRGTYVDANNDGICDNIETTASYNGNGRRMETPQQWSRRVWQPGRAGELLVVEMWHGSRTRSWTWAGWQKLC